MSLDQKLRRLPLSLEQRRLRDENIARLRAFAKLPPDQKPAPIARDRTSDYTPAPLTTKLMDFSK